MALPDTSKFCRPDGRSENLLLTTVCSEHATLSKLDDLYRLHRLLDGRRSTISRQTLILKTAVDFAP